MANTTCFGSRQVRRLRVALLQSHGAPDDGASNGYVTDQTTSIEMTPVLKQGEEFEMETGEGKLCMSFRDCDYIKGNDLVVKLCKPDAQLLGLMTGMTLFTSAGDTIGGKWPAVGDDCIAPVSVEWWTNTHAGAQQGEVGNVPQYWHWVVPYVRFVWGGHTFDKGMLVVTLNGKGQDNGNITANGPFDDWPSAVATTDGADSALAYWREGSLPAAGCAYVSVSSAAS